MNELPSTPSLGPSSHDSAPSSPVALDFDPTPPLAQDVLALFRGPFREVRFPGVSSESLDAEAHALLLRQAEVEALGQALDDARRTVKDASERLVVTAERALAYARVFALGQPALESALAQVRVAAGEPQSAQRGPKKRKSPRANASVQLPIDSASGSERTEPSPLADDDELAAE